MSFWRKTNIPGTSSNKQHRQRLRPRRCGTALRWNNNEGKLVAKRLAVTYRVYADGEALARAAAEHFKDRVEQAVAKRGRARIAISGGSTPKRTFTLLADANEPYGKEIPWDKVEMFWVDERTVGPDDPDSNYRMTRETLLSKVPLKPENVHRIEGELDPEEAAAKYESLIRRAFRLLHALILSGWAWAMTGTPPRYFRTRRVFTNWVALCMQTMCRKKRLGVSH
jgi:hypothetical protein